MVAKRRMVWKLDSSRSVKVTESPFQGSISVAPGLGWVMIVRDNRSSEAISKYLSTTATVLFQTRSKSVEGTGSGFVATGEGEKIRVRLRCAQWTGRRTAGLSQSNCSQSQKENRSSSQPRLSHDRRPHPAWPIRPKASFFRAWHSPARPWKPYEVVPADLDRRTRPAPLPSW